MEDALSKQVGDLLACKNLTLAVAESCTGGLLGHCITSISGSSTYFKGGVIAYSNDIKTSMLGVAPELLAREGAVSEAVAGAMAEGIMNRFGADIGIGITGVAGPTGGTDKKPIGLVYIGLTHNGDSVVRKFSFSGETREQIKQAGAQAALEMLIKYLSQ